MGIGVHAVLVYDDPTGAGPAVDLSCLVTSCTIRHGRDGMTGQPDASSATVDLVVRDDPLPPAVEVGSVLHVTTTTGAGASTRFHGRITDLNLGWADAGEHTPDRGIGQVTAVGLLADLGRRVVGAAPWPVERDGARVSRVFTASGVPFTAGNVDAGTLDVLARDVDNTDALSLVRDVAESAQGVVWQNRAGAICYADANHRRNLSPTLALDACDLLVTPTWRRSMFSLINQVSLGYGVPAAGASEQPRVTAIDAASQTAYGVWSYTTDTELAAAADATAMANLLLARYKTPPWVLAALPVHVAGLTATQYDALLALDLHGLLSLTGLPGIGAAPTSVSMWVEGWTETLAWDVHDIELTVSSYCHTVPPPRWNDIPPTWTWDTLRPPSLTWDQASCIGPPADFGRWDDIPASLTWDEVAATVTWDSWTTTPAAATAAQPIGA